MKKLAIGFLLLLLPTISCQSQKEDSKPPAQAPSSSPTTHKNPAVQPVSILASPMQVSLVELPTDALTAWRDYRDLRPTLVILSDDPFLEPIPQQLIEQSEALVLQGRPEDLRKMVAPFTPDPVLLPSMAVSAALQTGLFAKIIWVLPTETAPDKISLAAFKEQLLNYGALDQSDVESFIQQESSFVGTLRGMPFEAVFPFALPKLQAPALVHVDLSFFRPFYKTEISTPLLPILYGTLGKLRQAGWPTLAVTISYSNLTAELPLETRFIGGILQTLFREPSLLTKQPPINWQRQKDILYLENLFQPEKVLAIARAMEKVAPDDASVQFALYQAYRGAKEGDNALAHLKRAVELDRAYGLEYANLAPLATQKGRPDETVRMLKLAAGVFPENPFIPIELTQAHLHIGQKEEAIKILDSAIKLSWSPVYYPNMAANLKEFRSKLLTFSAEDQHQPATNRFDSYQRKASRPSSSH